MLVIMNYINQILYINNLTIVNINDFKLKNRVFTECYKFLEICLISFYI